ncbi:hypothetical protein BC835DRAFT_1370388 [Cytidiella melzeri]|nr:hypothetical protein BC835DRAFT_1370388 [Cytidiella melzeri]
MSCCDVSASEAKGEGHNPRDFSNLLLMEDVDRVIEQMDSEIQRIKEKMELELQRVLEQERVLYAHRNTLIPMSKLPPEVLRMIFRQSQWTAPWQRLNPAFAQVCSQWRTLALNDPFLWRTPYFYRQKHLSETLNRAKDLPLIIRHDCYVQEDTFEAVKTTLENKTVEHLELLFSGRSDRQVGTISRLVFEKSRLSLKFLALENGANKPVALLRSGREGNSLPFPLLRCLRLVNCTLPLELHCFPNLTTLELCCKCSQQLVDQAIHMNLASIVLVLRNCPKLERLELSKVIKDPNVSPPEQGVIEHPPENFRMQHLKYLGLRDRSSLLLPLIYILELPALSKLEITSSYSDSFDDRRSSVCLPTDERWYSQT